MPIWIATGDSESGDHYVIGWWSHKPTKKEMKKAYDDDDEWPFCCWELHKLEQEK